ncbi:MAG: hypothetical protein ACE5OZ_11130 [Candidatus Heimdallarchaeota archaeon]
MSVSKQQALQALEGINDELLIPIYVELYERTVHENSSKEDRKKGKEVMADVLSTASGREKRQLIANLIADRPELLLKISEDLERVAMSIKLLELKDLIE